MEKNIRSKVLTIGRPLRVEIQLDGGLYRGDHVTLEWGGRVALNSNGLLRAGDLLPGFRAGFTAVTRDESRHVSYGIWALRQAVRAGHEQDIRTVVDRTLAHCMGVYADPEVLQPDPRTLPPGARADQPGEVTQRR